jgi:hypothetical protein
LLLNSKPNHSICFWDHVHELKVSWSVGLFPRKIIAEDLADGFYPGVQPPADLQCHADVMVKLTLLRSRFTRTRLGEDEKVREIIARHRRKLNGDHRRNRLEHYCWEPDCCGGQKREVCEEEMHAILCESYFEDMGSNLPAENKWWTMSPHLSRQCGGSLCCQIVPRTVKRAFHVEPNVEEGSFHSDMNKKKQVSLDFYEDRGAAMTTLGVAVIGMDPVEHMSYRLQECDHQGGSGAELVDGSDQGLLIQTQMQLWEIVNPWHESPRSGHLESLLWHLEGAGVDKKTVNREMRTACVGLGAAVWAMELK